VRTLGHCGSANGQPENGNGGNNGGLHRCIACRAWPSRG
jgi:hypothetical protein